MELEASVEGTSELLEGIFELIASSAEPERAPRLRSFARALLCQAPADFFVGRTDADLVELVSSQFGLLESSRPDQIAVPVSLRPGYGHSGAVGVVISDRPFIVDTLGQYLTAKGFEIRRELHPIIVVERDDAGSIKTIGEWTHGSQQRALHETLEELKGAGVPSELAQRLAALQFLGEQMEVTRIAHYLGRPVADVGRVYFALAHEFDFAVMFDLLEMAPGEDAWEQRAAQGLMQDLGQARRNLTLAVLAGDAEGRSIEEQIDVFRSRHGLRLKALHGVLEELLASENINLAALTVATRETLRQSRVIRESCR
ncbi:MAG: hypothetical protein AMS25_01625 [Gemmatimonas sp. SM23_52]|nr:MAG: hypothetical protein AMS25_01625 [Gemmatimonas sp. SM23_52]